MSIANGFVPVPDATNGCTQIYSVYQDDGPINTDMLSFDDPTAVLTFDTSNVFMYNLHSIPIRVRAISG